MKELKKWLRFNALFSGISGSLMLILSDKLQVIFGFEQAYVFPFIGVNLFVFAVVLWILQRQEPPTELWVKGVVFLDIIWVLGSFGLIILQPFSLTLMGQVLIILVALLVGFLAFQQSRYNKKLIRN